MPNALSVTRQLVLTVLLVGAMFYDLRYRIVPNLLIVISMVAGVVLGVMEGIDVCLKTVLLALLISYPFYFGYEKGWMGGGDVKLVTAISILAGEQLAKTFFLAGTMGGGVVSLVGLLTSSVKSKTNNTTDGKQPVVVPYAAAYAACGLLVQMLLLGGTR